MNFSQKILLLRALRLPGEHWRAIDDFRRLRNEFAHDKSVTLHDLGKLVRAILTRPPPIFQTMQGTTFEITHTASGDRRTVRYEDMDERERVVTAAIHLATYLTTLPETFDFPPPTQKVIFIDSHKA